ncbi:hypothetical protein [Streptococcus merionis]|uniref:hypothetical protein n=1 Tax=Streptococcus merionis TaxID=400065 RepID=UPI0035138801
MKNEKIDDKSLDLRKFSNFIKDFRPNSVIQDMRALKNTLENKGAIDESKDPRELTNFTEYFSSNSITKIQSPFRKATKNGGKSVIFDDVDAPRLGQLGFSQMKLKKIQIPTA